MDLAEGIKTRLIANEIYIFAASFITGYNTSTSCKCSIRNISDGYLIGLHEGRLDAKAGYPNGGSS